jgi:hypothetical protein
MQAGALVSMALCREGVRVFATYHADDEIEPS